ncbi:GGDEF domain-containing protein [Patescibacteria group bacterium]
MKRGLVKVHLGAYTCLIIGFVALLMILHAVSNAYWQATLIAVFVLILIKGYSLQNMLDTHDLTGLLSRRKLNRELDRFYSRRRERAYASLLFIDLDQFKKINDHVGHMRGDEILQGVAEEVRNNVYLKDVVANFGGDEIVVILHDAPRKRQIRKAAEKIRSAVENVLNHDSPWDLPFQVTVSIGAVALRNSKLKSAKDVLAHADLAVKHAKKGGKNRTVIYNASGEYQTL